MNSQMPRERRANAGWLQGTSLTRAKSQHSKLELWYLMKLKHREKIIKIALRELIYIEKYHCVC